LEKSGIFGDISRSYISQILHHLLELLILQPLGTHDSTTLTAGKGYPYRLIV
jgi:hypothetical protein